MTGLQTRQELSLPGPDVAATPKPDRLLADHSIEGLRQPLRIL
jgi:hypothetical protein